MTYRHSPRILRWKSLPHARMGTRRRFSPKPLPPSSIKMSIAATQVSLRRSKDGGTTFLFLGRNRLTPSLVTLQIPRMMKLSEHWRLRITSSSLGSALKHLSFLGCIQAANAEKLRAPGEKTEWGTSPRSLINELLSSGVVTRSEFQEIEGFFSMRNAIAHGYSGRKVDSNSVRWAYQYRSKVT